MSKLTVLVSPINAVGHVNACSGALTGLLARGHRVVFVLEKAFEGKLVPLGYEEYIWKNAPPSGEKPTDEQPDDQQENPGERIANFLMQSKIIGPFTPLEKMENMVRYFENKANQAEFKLCNATVKSAIQKYQPDVIYIDGNLLPCVYYSDIPWIKQISMVPLFYNYDPELPPGGSGLPTDDKTDWHLWEHIRHKLEYSSEIGDIVQELGYDRYPNDLIVPNKQIMTVYAYPDELNYQRVREKKDWFNLEAFSIQSESNRLDKLSEFVPKEFLEDTLEGKFSGKLIYVSMGSMGSVDLELMDRLLSVLATTSHKYIVSKGLRHQEYSLPGANMWGDRYLAQKSIVPHVDLVITHGGNNTVTETFAEGKPMIVLPLFADQFDNAQRLHETGFGAKVDPYAFTKEELVAAIEKLLNDTSLRDKLANASSRILSLKQHEMLALQIEELLK